jgi:hypothetical protein
MVSKRAQRVKELYEEIIISEADSVDPKEWLKKLLPEEKGKEDTSALEKTLLGPEEEREEEEEIAQRPIPGEVIETEVPEQMPLFPGSEQEFMPFVKKLAPGGIAFVECPVCGARNDPLELLKGEKGKSFQTREECANCQKLYIRMNKLTEDEGMTPEEAIAEVARTSRYDKPILTQIWESSGSTDISEEEQQLNPQPSDRDRAKFLLEKVLNIKRRPDGEPLTDAFGNPRPLSKQRYVTLYHLAKKLRWEPDHLLNILEDAGKKVMVPIAGKTDVPETKPALERDLTDAERAYRILQVQLSKTKEPLLRGEIEAKMTALEKEMESEKAEPSKKRFKREWYNIWDMKAIEDVIKNRMEEVETIIMPIEKAIYFGSQARRYAAAAEKAAQEKERLENMKTSLKENLDAFTLKSFQRLYKFRTAKNARERTRLQIEFGISQEVLERSYGKSLDSYLNMHGRLERRIANQEQREISSTEKSDSFAERFQDYTTEMGYEWFDEVTGEPIINSDEIFNSMMGFIDEKTGEIPQEPTEKKRAEEIQNIMKTADSPEEDQLSLWEEEKIPDTETAFGPEPREIPKPEPPETKKPELEPEPEEVDPEETKPKLWQFGNVQGIYNYKISVLSADGQKNPKLPRMAGKMKFTPGYKYESLQKALEDKVPGLLKKYNLGSFDNASILITVSFKPRSQSYLVKIVNGNIKWLGNHGVKKQLLEAYPELKKEWQLGLLKIEDLVELNGTLLEKSVLEKGYVGPTEEKKVMKTKPTIKEKHKPKVKSAPKKQVLQEKLQAVEKELAVSPSKELENQKTKLLDELEEIGYEEELQETEFKPEESPFYTPIVPGKEEEKLPRKSCPYPGCEGYVYEGGDYCPTCNSPIDTETKINKIVLTFIPKNEEIIDPNTGTPIINPETGEAEKERVGSIPQYSLVTIQMKNDEPQWAECSQLTSKTKKHVAFPNVQRMVDSFIKKLDGSEYAEEQKKMVTTLMENDMTIAKKHDELDNIEMQLQGADGAEQERLNKRKGAIIDSLKSYINIKKSKLYENAVNKLSELERLPENAKPWTYELISVSAPGTSCQKCPDRIQGPFNEDKLKAVKCWAVKKAILSLTKSTPQPNVWPYHKFRSVTEKEKERAKKEPARKRIDVSPWWRADDKFASRFEKIIILSQLD